MSEHKGTVAVLGAGTMGRGIAQVAATAGYKVVVRDLSAEQLALVSSSARSSLERMVAKGKVTAEARDAALARLHTTQSFDEAVEAAEVVIEAVPEKMDLKLELFRALDRAAPAHALLATNTSSLSVTEMASAVADPGRVVGLHFFNPVPVMELCEVVRGLRTSEGSVQRALELVSALGKSPVVVRDFPGFATSRLGVILGVEAIRMVEQGVASPADIDRAMKLGYRHPMGPLELGDLVGLDVRLNILEHLHRELGDQFRPPVLLRQMVRAGKLGKKTGEGFYRWEGDRAVPVG